MNYYERAESISRLWPDHLRLPWLKARDEEDRTMWVHEFQHSTRPLGQIITYVMQKRDAHWVGPSPPPSAISNGGGQQQSPAPGQQPANKKTKFGKGQAAQTCEAKTDGTEFCKNFNSHRGCTKPGKRCYLHNCSGKTADGNPCGGNHRAVECTNPNVPKR